MTRFMPSVEEETEACTVQGTTYAHEPHDEVDDSKKNNHNHHISNDKCLQEYHEETQCPSVPGPCIASHNYNAHMFMHTLKTKQIGRHARPRQASCVQTNVLQTAKH